MRNLINGDTIKTYAWFVAMDRERRKEEWERKAEVKHVIGKNYVSED